MAKPLAICGNCNEPTGSDTAPSACDLCGQDVCQHCGREFLAGDWSEMAHHFCIERRRNAYEAGACTGMV